VTAIYHLWLNWSDTARASSDAAAAGADLRARGSGRAWGGDVALFTAPCVSL